MGSVHETLMEAERIKAWLLEQGEDDPELLRDMLEGETDIHEIRDWAIRKFLDEKAFIAAIKKRVDDINARKKAAEKRLEKMKLVITDCMNATEEKSYRGAEATISVSNVKPKLIITDESLIPEKFLKVKKEINKSDINKAFEEGEEIPGTSLDNGGTTTTIRSK